jgi:hypothetical protein
MEISAICGHSSDICNKLTLGVDWCFYVIAISYLCGIGHLIAIRRKEIKSHSAKSTVKGNFFEELKIIISNSIVFALFLMAVSCEIFGWPFQSLLPIFARDTLNIGAFGLGMLGTMQSVGATLGVLMC